MKFLSFNEQIAEYEKMIETLQINFKQMEAEKNETILSKEEEIKVVSAKILVLESNITQKEEEADVSKQIVLFKIQFFGFRTILHLLWRFWLARIFVSGTELTERVAIECKIKFVCT